MTLGSKKTRRKQNWAKKTRRKKIGQKKSAQNIRLQKIGTTIFTHTSISNYHITCNKKVMELFLLFFYPTFRFNTAITVCLCVSLTELELET